MKKILSGVLASAMVASMAVASFAAGNVDAIGNGGAHKYDEDNSTFTAIDMVAPGTTMYYTIVSGNDYVTDSKYVKSVSVKQKWEFSGSLVEKVEIVKKKHAGADNKYVYFVGVSVKDSTSTKTADLVGDITFKKSGNDGFSDIVLNVNIPVGFETAEGNEITKTTKIFDFANAEETTLDFAGGYYTVATNGQSKILLSATTKYNADVAAKFPQANLDFVTFKNASFNKIGELTIEAEEGSFLYEIKDGVLTAVKNTYDEYEGAFKVKTRTLGSYVISDVELKAGSVEGGSSSNTDETKPNPGTGAIA